MQSEDWEEYLRPPQTGKAAMTESLPLLPGGKTTRELRAESQRPLSDPAATVICNRRYPPRG